MEVLVVLGLVPLKIHTGSLVGGHSNGQCSGKKRVIQFDESVLATPRDKNGVLFQTVLSEAASKMMLRKIWGLLANHRELLIKEIQKTGRHHMRISRRALNYRKPGIVREAATFVSVFALLAGSLSFGVSAQRKTVGQAPGLTDDQRIIHVLNRLGFGARPGDVERVKSMGLDKYIEQQLSPEKINDAVADAKLKDLTTLSMTTAELYQKYPQPGLLIRQLERRGELPADLKEAQKNRTKNGALADAPPNANAPDPNAAATRNSPEYRRALREYYQQNGLQLPARIVAELQASRILRAVYSERQLQEVMVDFWTNHFNVFAGKGADRWLLVSYDRDTIRPNALGKFSNLLQATSQSPAMLFYLDNFQSVSPNAQLGSRAGQRPRTSQRGGLFGLFMGVRQNRQPGVADQSQPPANAQRQRRGINENYARELMELHTLGVDGGYTQKDVQEVARCFTGWTILAPRGGGAAAQAMRDGPRADMLRENAGRFYFNPRAHDDGEKVVLGRKIPAGGGFKDGLMVLDILAHSPATAKFVATKLVRHFVSDDAPPALVDRVAATFSKSDGDIRETLRAIFLSAEFNSTAAYRAKVKRPFELAISAIRTLGADTTGGPQLHQWIARMGEPLYGFQTPNGYSDTAEAWVNTGGLLERLNFGLMLASNRIPGTHVDLKRFLANGATDQSTNKARIMDRFLDVIVAGDITPKTKETLLKHLNEEKALVVPAQSAATTSASTSGATSMGADDSMSGEMLDEPQAVTRRPQRQQLARADAAITDPITKIVGLILGSPEFQRQ